MRHSPRFLPPSPIAIMTDSYRAITLEEHIAFPAMAAGEDQPFYKDGWRMYPDKKAKARDHGPVRLADMDAGSIAVQVLSHIPGIGISNPAICRAANDQMAEAIRQNPTRFAGFAALPMGVPEEAVKELRRTVTELGFLGALVDNHLEDMTHYDDARFWPVFEAAQDLDVPLYLHPAPPTQDIFASTYAGNYPHLASIGLGTACWGWHQDVGLHVLKLYLAGVFTRFPRLKIAIGHMGEMLPIMLDRAAAMPAFRAAVAHGARPLREVWDTNIWVTTSGIFSLDTFQMLRQVTKLEHILFSVDYPFDTTESGKLFMDALHKSGMLTEDEFDMVVRKNAITFLKLDKSE